VVIRNIWAVGRNFKDHAKEMGAPPPDRPMIFLKAGSSATVGSSEIWLPEWTTSVDHELELAFRFDAFLRVKEAALALDLTERNEQQIAKKEGLPWTRAKSFDEACPMTPTFLIQNLEELEDKPYRLWVNDELKQEGLIGNMIFSPAFLLSYVQDYFPVTGGDFFLTGTPAGVGPIKAGDTIKVQMQGYITHIWKVYQNKKQEDPA